MTRQRKYGSKYRSSRSTPHHGGRGRGRSWRTKSGAAAIGESAQHRSGTDVVEGGASVAVGEPPFGYGTEQPGVQNGGKR
jgi:hypothetical protein